MRLYELLDELSVAWKEVEKQVCIAPMKEDGLRLSVERHNGLKLCFDGRPIAECKAQEKIDAVDHFDAFLVRMQLNCDQLEKKAEQAVKKLQEWLDAEPEQQE